MGKDYVKWLAVAVIGYWIWKNTNIGSSLNPRSIVNAFTGDISNVPNPRTSQNYFGG